MLLALVSLAAAQALPSVTPPTGLHLGLGAGVGSSLGGAIVGASDSMVLGNASYNSSYFWIAGSVRIRSGERGFTWEPEVECATGAAASFGADDEPTARVREGECRAGVSFRPRIGVRGSMELHAVVGVAYAGEWATNVDPDDTRDVRNRTLEHGIQADAGLALQKWLTPDITLSVDVHAVEALVSFVGTEDDTGELTSSVSGWNLALDPGTRLMLHLYW